MGIGTKRNKGNDKQFLALEDIYMNKSRTAAGRAELLSFIDYLRLNPRKTTCDGLMDVLKVDKLGPDAVAAINRNWYGIGGQAQWRADSTVNPAEIQLVNRAATIHYLTELVRLADKADEEQDPERRRKAAPRMEIWGQCQPPGFSVDVHVTEPEGEQPFITVDYRVPFNYGDYAGPPENFARYPVQAYDEDPDGVSYLEDPIFNSRRFVYLPAVEDLLPAGLLADAQATAVALANEREDAIGALNGRGPNGLGAIIAQLAQAAAAAAALPQAQAAALLPGIAAALAAVQGAGAQE
jgi:hypothetical protein